jgi:hypothetical protein
VLTRLLETDSSAHRLWRGPRGHHHDFSALYDAVEVKASIGGEDRRVRIHGLEQLQSPVDGSLQLAWYDLRRTSEQGEGLLELIERALRLCDDESALLGLLAAIGFRSFDAAFYQDVRFVVIEERWYEVDSSFPKLISNDLVKAGIPISVADVNYTIDLSTEPPSPLESTRVSEHLSSMIREAT